MVWWLIPLLFIAACSSTDDDEPTYQAGEPDEPIVVPPERTEPEACSQYETGTPEHTSCMEGRQLLIHNSLAVRVCATPAEGVTGAAPFRYLYPDRNDASLLYEGEYSLNQQACVDIGLSHEGHLTFGEVMLNGALHLEPTDGSGQPPEFLRPDSILLDQSIASTAVRVRMGGYWASVPPPLTGDLEDGVLPPEFSQQNPAIGWRAGGFPISYYHGGEGPVWGTIPEFRYVGDDGIEYPFNIGTRYWAEIVYDPPHEHRFVMDLFNTVAGNDSPLVSGDASPNKAGLQVYFMIPVYPGDPVNLLATNLLGYQPGQMDWEGDSENMLLFGDVPRIGVDITPAGQGVPVTAQFEMCPETDGICTDVRGRPYRMTAKIINRDGVLIELPQGSPGNSGAGGADAGSSSPDAGGGAPDAGGGG